MTLWSTRVSLLGQYFKMWIFPCFWKTLVLLNARSLYIHDLQLYRVSSSRAQSTSLWIILGFSRHHTFSRRLTFPVSTHYFLWSVFFLVFVLHCFRRSPRSGFFYLLGNPLSINQSINHLDLVVSYKFWAEEQECRHMHAVPTIPGTIACIRFGASSRKRHGNRHAKPAGLRVPVRSNLRKFLVKCSTSVGFFVNFYTLFFSTTSSILLRKV